MLKWIIGALGTASLVLISGLAWLTASSGTARAETVTVYKTPWCGCCTAWIKHLRRDGLEVRVIEREDLATIRDALDVPDQLASCHTAEFAGYAVEGHVPAADIRRLISERPVAAGLSVPGMPLGSPGMETQGPSDAYEVILFGDGPTRVYASYVGHFPTSETDQK
ncbi:MULTISPECIES: DUF411 domain-containing protein [Hyphomonas]|uniref:CopG family transcriptional regulator n=1 Tax=Hyphomonas adhaerens TaxID=81029 RepID=A0A3B9GVE3_9PROT|nr:MULTISPECIES: DUF411 domain-containing protein [Hyphomonas]MBB38491.1 CopG family transcriptional regulator [Hyphomonas sp.]HAE26236.1 CopG family transcriptional regulator [Hyphomonas adhaerens]